MVNTVTAVVFDYRGFDTMGEELLLFAAASATALLLRHTRADDTRDIVAGIRSDAVRAVGAVTAVAALVLGLDTVAHGFITPGGGFCCSESEPSPRSWARS
jgi:multicomponent Na+:H+ antiporter subunit B